MRCLVTGGMGFLGSHLAQALLERGDEVTCLDLDEPRDVVYLRDWDKYTPVVDTIVNTSVVSQLAQRAEVIFHLAAVAEPESYVRYPRKTMDINLRATLSLLDHVICSGKRFFFPSTSEIYGKNATLPFREESDRVLGSTDINRWCYSSSKALIEHYLLALYQEHLLDVVGIRIFNCYGPRLKGRVVSKFVESVLKDRPIEIHGDGSQTRCYTWVEDIVEGIIKLIDSPRSFGAFYNIGNPAEEYSVSALASIICDQVGKSDHEIIFRDRAAYGTSYEDVDRRVPDISKIKRAIGWEPKTSLMDGIGRMVEYETAKVLLK